MPKAKRKDLDKMARIAAKGTIRDALLAGGYSSQTAARGLAALPQGEREKFKQARHEYALKKLGKFEDLGKNVTPEQQEHVVRGALLENVVTGKDRATASLKMLGTDKRIQMFTPESAQGILVINAVAIPSFDNIPGLGDEPNTQLPKPAQFTPAKLPQRAGDCGWDKDYGLNPPEKEEQ